MMTTEFSYLTFTFLFICLLLFLCTEFIVPNEYCSLPCVYLSIYLLKRERVEPFDPHRAPYCNQEVHPVTNRNRKWVLSSDLSVGTGQFV